MKLSLTSGVFGVGALAESRETRGVGSLAESWETRPDVRLFALGDGEREVGRFVGGGIMPCESLRGSLRPKDQARLKFGAGRSVKESRWTLDVVQTVAPITQGQSRIELHVP